jgi:hypothetical protein
MVTWPSANVEASWLQMVYISWYFVMQSMAVRVCWFPLSLSGKCFAALMTLCWWVGPRLLLLVLALAALGSRCSHHRL